ncbi:MAG: alpha/beta hydrolase, partial [Chloroflexi bacterium]|nr:alpha/beta hydrolase [Chloroflexota bacterium]
PPQLPMPVLMLVGDGDVQTPHEFVQQLASQLSNARVHVLHGTDHYYHGCEADVAALVAAFLQQQLHSTRPITE